MFRESLGKLLFALESKEPHPSQFVGYVEENISDVDDVLRERGFERCGFAQWKEVDGDEQLHVFAYPGTEFDAGGAMDTYLFAHWETRPEKHPIAFLREENRNVSKGVNEMRRHLNLASIPFHNDETLR